MNGQGLLTALIRIRVTPAEKSRLVWLAGNEGYTGVSQYVRHALARYEELVKIERRVKLSVDKGRKVDVTAQEAIRAGGEKGRETQRRIRDSNK